MTDEKRIWEVIKSLTLQEKAALCVGSDSWTTVPYADRGVPALRMADGPHGLRREVPERAGQNGAQSYPATCFPPAACMACSWDTALVRRVGEALGDEAKSAGVHILLGPGVNIKRSPLCGRNFEYFSEDPLLAGELGAAWIEGVQSRGVGASLKHFALNNQETKRMSVSAAADPRAFYDIYLKPFEIAVKKAKPATVMASYNKIDGVYACDNRRLLTEILRLRFGFAGLVMSDWGAECDRAAGIAAGCDLEMPASYGVGAREAVRAVTEGKLPEDALDTACWNVLRTVYAYARGGEAPEPCDLEAHDRLAAEALCKSAVLLKNEGGLLPFSKDEPLVVIGEMAERPHFQGGGSSGVNPAKLTGFLDALNAAGTAYTYRPGYRGYGTDAELLGQAAEAAAGGGQVVLFLGLPDLYDCEGYDREDMRLPDFQLKLLDAVSAVNGQVCVVLCAGGPVETPWIDKIGALLCLHVGGQAVGEGARRLLAGEACPAGKLAESWPVSLADTPCFHAFPMGPREVAYRESLYVGYRYYDTADKAVRFPFGYGLSYTEFAYGNLRLGAETLSEGGALRVSFTVTNTGGAAGEEISQVYISRKGSAMWQPAHELAGFARTRLESGEAKTVEITLPYGRFACHDPATGGTVVEGGGYEIQAGGHSRSLPLRAAVEVKGVSLAPSPAFARGGFYGRIRDNSFPEEEFALLYARPLQGNAARKKGEYTMDTSLGEMTDSAIVRFFIKRALAVGRSQMHFARDTQAAEKALRSGVDNLPFKSLAAFSRGVLSAEATRELLRACNGKGGLARALLHIVKNRKKLKDLTKACP